ncbi:hypothetical protein JKF63_00890 [Porcisia hertigi]|uniref:Rab-GAP TBC domain-containing protein n=1 Tax=Porcisia hertigi TaxID=2761500 RepID=A0A836IAE8_9TRYP|nr:hypothetical protein JKF63_00890 [Porcisia hertigi]
MTTVRRDSVTTANVSPTTVIGGALLILPHAEEVHLRRGLMPVAISSTTGRLNRAAVDSDSEEEEEAILHDRGGSSHGREECQTAPGSPDTSSRQSRFHVISTQMEAVVSAHRRAAASKRFAYECYDMFGFRVTEVEKAAEDYERHAKGYSQEYLGKWQHMVSHWASVRPDTLKRYCRRGVPQALRHVVWQRLLESWGMKESHPGVYMRLRSDPLVSEDLKGIIERDLDRTFPTHRLFSSGGLGQGQQMLRSILHAYANYDPSVGYCQGMGFLAATLILQVEEEESAFWAFVALMNNAKYNMRVVFSPGFPQLQCCFHVFEELMHKKMPKLYTHLHDRHHIHPSFYAVHWFMTVFTYYFNFGLVSRIWDMFLCEGWKPVYRIALALLKMDRRRLLSLGTETEVLLALKDIQESKRPVELLKTALNIRFSSAYVRALVEAYNAPRV